VVIVLWVPFGSDRRRGDGGVRVFQAATLGRPAGICQIALLPRRTLA
jgi:hypothetical protein